jgi:hypothetical protein
MGTAIILILLGALARIVPHPANAVPMGALALYAGARLPRRWAALVPLAAMVLSDLVLDWVVYPMYRTSPFGLVRLTGYATFILIAGLGSLKRGDADAFVRGGMSLGASTLFFLTSNFAVWAADQGHLYATTPAGLAACYVAAIPFFGNTVVADLIGTAALFGLDPVRSLAKPKVAAATE